MSDIYKRQSSLITEQARQARILIVGAGGIGSHTALALARMGYHNLTIYDDDVVDTHNLSSQGFDYRDIGKPKVQAVRSKILAAVRAVVTVHNKKVMSNTNLTGYDIVILAVDNMQARREIILKAAADGVPFIINPAMGGEYMSMDIIQDGFSEYAANLHTDENSVQESCTSRATIYTTLLIGGTICKAVKDITMGNPHVTHMAWDIKNNSPVAIFNSEGEDLL